MADCKYVPLTACAQDEDDKMDLFKSTETHFIFGTPTKKGKYCEPELTKLQQWRICLINLYVTDALSTRPPNKKLETPFACLTLCGLPVYLNNVYRVCHNSFWSTFVYASIWAHLGLIVFEPYANTDTEVYRWWLYVVECVILFIYTFDVYLHYLSHDTDNYWDLSWAKLIVACIILNFLDVIASLVVKFVFIDGFILRFGALLRPIFLVTRSQFLRATCRSIINSIPRVLDVLLLVALYISMFSVLGYVLFSEKQMKIGVHVDAPNQFCDEAVASGFADTDCDLVQADGNVNFETLPDSLFSLFVLLTTANFPDVMMPSFHKSKYTGFFFVTFIAFGIYYLMPIIFAVIYHQYHEDTARFVSKMTNNRAKALDAAFKQMIILSKEMQAHPKVPLSEEEISAIDFNSERIYFPLFRRVIQSRRSKLKDNKTRILYNAICEARSRVEAVKLHEDEGIGITREQWQNFYKFVNVEIFRDPQYAVEHIIKTGKENVMVSLILGDESIYSMDDGSCAKCCLRRNQNAIVVGDRQNQCCFHCTQLIYFTWLRFRGVLYRIFTHYIVSRLIDLLVWSGTLVLIYEVTVEDDPILEQISDILIIVFVVEVTLRFIAFGRYFLRDGFNVLDFVVIYVSWIASVQVEGWDFSYKDYSLHTNSNALVAFRLLRFVRALGTIERFKLIISTSITVLKKVGLLYTLELGLFYTFAVIGAFCFGGAVSKETSLSQLEAAIQAENVDDTGFWQYIRDNYYYDNNMNEIGNTLVVMVELTVVNQWHAVTRMYVELTSSWTYFYFLSFYFLSVIIVINVLTAFVLDSFIITFQQNEIEQADLKKKKARQHRLKQLKKLQKERQIRLQRRKNAQKKIKELQQKQKQKAARNRTKSFKKGSSLFQSLIPLSSSIRRVNSGPFADKEDPIISSPKDSEEGPELSHHDTDDEIERMGSEFLDTTIDILDEYLKELNETDKEDWHKWIAVAMLYEFDTDDVIKGAWLYDRVKTTADLYEQIYGQIQRPFVLYLEEWGETLPIYNPTDDDDNREDSPPSRSASFAGAADDMDRTESMRSNAESIVTGVASLETQGTIRGRGKDIFVTRRAIKQKSVTDGTRTEAFSVTDRHGNTSEVKIQGPRQSNIFAALSTAPRVGFAPQIENKQQASKVSKMLDW